MISYEGFQDALTAILVIVIISVIITIAWLSTYVREQPLIATAVVVFQSGTNAETEMNSLGNDVRHNNSNNGNNSTNNETQEVASMPSQSIHSNKENDSSVIEAKHKCEENESKNITKVVDINLSENNSEIVSDKESCKGATALSTSISTPSSCSIEKDEDILHHSSQGSTDVLDHAENFTFSNPSSKRSRKEDTSDEMEVRNRRLRHFVSMGKSSVNEENHEDTTSSVAKLKVESSQACVDKEGKTLEEKVDVKDTTNLDQSVKEEERPPGSIKIRLKFLDETQRFVFAQPTEQVGSFKRQHFSIEMDANRRIRLIFNGQLLSQDSSTLAQYGLFDNCVVHCHVSQPQLIGQNGNNQSRDLSAQDDEDAYVSGLLAPLLYCVMVIMWYLRYEYSHLFNTMSTVILLFLTALLLISTYLLYITQNVPGNDNTAQISSRHQIDTDSLL